MWIGKITVITENTIYYKKKAVAEEGIAILIQEFSPDTKSVLFDLGRRWSTFENNLKIQGFPLDSIDAVVPSHGHAGHVGALSDGIQHMNKPDVILHPGIFRRKAKKDAKGLKLTPEFLKQEDISQYSNLIVTKRPVQITEHIWTSGEIPIINNAVVETDDKYRHWVIDGDRVETDDFIEENAIFICSSSGIFIVTACSHRGLPNIIELARSTFPEYSVIGVLGGFHLMQRPETTTAIVDYLKTLDLKYVMPCHCTGFMGKKEICNALPSSFYPVSIGTCVDFDNDICIDADISTVE